MTPIRSIPLPISASFTVAAYSFNIPGNSKTPFLQQDSLSLENTIPLFFA